MAQPSAFTPTRCDPSTREQVAEVLECDDSTLSNLELQEKLHPVGIERSGKRLVHKKYTASEVDALRPLFRMQRDLHAQGFSDTDNGRRYTLEKGAKESGLALSLLK